MSGRSRKPLSPDLLGETASIAAQQNAMERGCKFLPHGCRLFEVEQGWESITIRRDKGVVIGDTLLALESALRDPAHKIIFIPLDASLTDHDIEKLCQRNAIVKTFFREVKKS